MHFIAETNFTTLVWQRLEFLEIYFNLDPFAFDQDDLDAMVFKDLIKTGDLADPVISKVIDNFKADGDGHFDILIDLDQDGWELAFNGGEMLFNTRLFLTR